VGASERVFELLDRTPQLTEPGAMEPMGAPEGGDIDLQNVTCADAVSLLLLESRLAHASQEGRACLAGGAKSAVQM